MSAFRRDWLTEISSLQREMERLLDHYSGAKPPIVQFAKRAWEPAVDVYETEHDIMVIVDLAGVDENGIVVSADRNALIIRGERVNPGAGVRRSYHIMEITSGTFERVIPLPVTGDPSRAEASYSRGMLEIRVPRDGRKLAGEARVKIMYGRRTGDGD